MVKKNKKLVSLGDIGTFKAGKNIKKNELTTEGAPFIHYGEIYSFYDTVAIKTKSFIPQSMAEKHTYARKGDAVIAYLSICAKQLVPCVAWMGEGEVVVGAHVFVFSHSLNPLYLAYFFQSNFFSSQKKRYVMGSFLYRISAGDLGKILIPVPENSDKEESLVRQSDSIKILTALHTLKSKLKKCIELQEIARINLINKVFNFDLIKHNKACLGNLGTFYRGRGISKKEIKSEGCPCVPYGEVHSNKGMLLNETKNFTDDNVKLVKVPSGSLLIAGTSMTLNDAGISCLWNGSHQIAIGGHIYAYVHRLNPLYVFYFFNSRCYFRQKSKMVTGVSLYHLYEKDLIKIEIPLLSNEEQDKRAQEAYYIDSKYTELTNKMKRELELREKQFRFYLNQIYSV